MTDYSRPLKLAEAATGKNASELERHLAEQRVRISIDPDIPGALHAGRTLMTTLARLPGQTELQAHPLTETQIDALLAATAAVVPGGVDVVTDVSSIPSATVHFGLEAPAGVIRAVPDGYGARVASDDSVVLQQGRAANALGSTFTAALAATEVFKIIAGVPESRARLHRSLSYCPVTLSADLASAPDLPSPLRFSLAIVGLGAVGSAVAAILSELDGAGELLLVDRERFAPENVATYSLGGIIESRARPWKVDLAAASLERYVTSSTTEPVENLPREIDAGARPWPSIVLSGLDSISARHAAQRLWPDILIDAATGDTMVGVHVAEPDQPCLMCFLPARHNGLSAAERLAVVTGLPIARAARGDNPLTENDLSDLTQTQRSLLAPHLGQPVCGLADALGLSGLDAEGYQPAIPFAAQQAACLGVGRLVAYLLGFHQPINFVQYDVLRGPLSATVEKRSPIPGCYCSERHTTILNVRAARQRGPRLGG